MDNLILISFSRHELKCLIEASVEKAIKDNKSTPPLKDEEEYLTIKQASSFTHIAVTTLYDYTHKRKIPFNKVGKKLLFSKKELTKWIQSHRKKTIDEIEDNAQNWLK